MTARRRELVLRKQFTNAYERQLAVFQSDELHPAKTNARVTISIVREDNLIGRQRHSDASGKNHERARRSVSDDRKQ